MRSDLGSIHIWHWGTFGYGHWIGYYDLHFELTVWQLAIDARLMLQNIGKTLKNRCRMSSGHSAVHHWIRIAFFSFCDWRTARMANDALLRNSGGNFELHGFFFYFLLTSLKKQAKKQKTTHNFSSGPSWKNKKQIWYQWVRRSQWATSLWCDAVWKKSSKTFWSRYCCIRRGVWMDYFVRNGWIRIGILKRFWGTFGHRGCCRGGGVLMECFMRICSNVLW